MDTFENVIFRNTFVDAVKQAVQEAVAEANALGLPKAYDPDFSQAQSTMAIAIEQETCGRNQIALVNPAIDGSAATASATGKPKRA